MSSYQNKPFKDFDLIDRLISEWKTVRPDLNLEPMEVVGRLITLGHRLEVHTNNALGQFAINYADFDVMATLRRSGSPYCLTVSQLEKSVLISSETLGSLVGRLHNQGLVVSGNEGGEVTVELSKKGFCLIERAIETRFSAAEDAVSYLDAEDTGEFVRLLSLLSRQLDGNYP